MSRHDIIAILNILQYSIYCNLLPFVTPSNHIPKGNCVSFTVTVTVGMDILRCTKVRHFKNPENFVNHRKRRS